MSGPEVPLWRTPGFPVFLGATTVAHLGDRVTELALPLLAVTTLAATPAQVGLLTAALWAPNVLALLVGAWVDGLARKRRVLVAADLLRAAVLVALPVAHVLGDVPLGLLYAVALVSGVGQVLYSSAYPPFFVALVPRDRFVEANGLLSTSRSLSFTAGPPLGGLLVQVLTAPVAVLVDAASFVVSAVVVGRTPLGPAAACPAQAAPLGVRLREGLSYVRRSPYLRATLACASTVNLFTFLAQAILVLFASRTLGLSPAQIGLVLGTGAAGGVAGAVLAPRLAARYGVGRMIVLGAVLFPAPLGVLALAGGPVPLAMAVVAAAELVSSAAVMVFDVNLNSLNATVTADAVRSRVAGVYGTVNYGVRPVGAALGGLLGGTLGLRPTLVLAAAGGTAGVLWLLRSPVPAVRELADVAAQPVEPSG